MIDAFELTRQVHSPFVFYSSRDDRVHLVETGMGRNAAAGGVMFAYHRLGAPPHVAWLNVGIAGHGGGTLGTAYRIHKITELSTKRTFYPAQIVANELPGAPLITVDSPAADLVEGCCYDMEASAVFDMARKLGSQELISMVKLVSDNGLEKGQIVRKADATAWIAGAIPALGEMVAGLLELSCLESGRLARTDITRFLARHHFSVTQSHQLRATLRRWHGVGLPMCPYDESEGQGSAKSVIQYLTTIVDHQSVDWSQP